MRRVILTIIVCVIAFLVYDYTNYHAQLDAAKDVVSRHDGRIGFLSILVDWPLGREIRVTMTRPVTDEELKELQILNSLRRRHWVGVHFDCDLTDDEFRSAREALHECWVGWRGQQLESE